MLVGLDWCEPMLFLQLHITCSCIFTHTYLTFSIFLYIDYIWSFSMFLSPSLSLLFTLVASWHLNVNLLHLETLFVLGHPLLLTSLPLTSSSVIKRPNQTSLRTFHNTVFIRNAKSFCQIFLTLTYLLSSTEGVGFTMWCPGHMHFHDHIGVLLQYAQI